MVWQFCQHYRVRARLINNGDDCVLIVEQRDVQRIIGKVHAWFLRYGFSMKVEDPVRELERVEFCQMRPVWNGLDYVMCRNPLKCMSKDLMCLHPDTNPYRNWLGGVATAGLALTAGVPVLQEFYRQLSYLGSGVLSDDSGMQRLAQGLSPMVKPITREARLSFYKAFGVPPWVQVNWETEWAHKVDSTDWGRIEISHLYQTTELEFQDQYGSQSACA